MNKIITLGNGLTVVFLKDESKHSSIAYLITKFGGINREILVNNKKISFSSGYAHFLEHLLIEKSKYGNMVNYFSQEYVDFNGLTNNRITNFYIDTIHDFDKYLKILIDFVNNPVFTKKDIKDVKEAIIEEIGENVDNNFYKLNKETGRCLFNNVNYENILGEKEDIKEINYENVILCYKTFYKPSNQILVVAGNIDIESTLELIKNIYLKNTFKYNNEYKIPIIKEDSKVKVKEKNLKVDINKDYTRISYKINVSKLNSYERVKLSFFLGFFIDMNFKGTSNFYKELISKKISVYDVDTSIEFLNDFLIFEVGTYTDKKEMFIKLVNEEINNKKFNKKEFENNKKQTIIDLILREDNLYNMVNPFVDNIISFEYFDLDKIEDIESFTFLDYKEYINNLDFDNYTIVSLIK